MQVKSHGYEIFIDNLKQKLKLKVLSIYVITENERNDIIELIYKTQNIDDLYEIDKKLDTILKGVGTATVKIMDENDMSLLEELKNIIKNEIIDKIVKTQESLELDLQELENHFQMLANND